MIKLRWLTILLPLLLGGTLAILMVTGVISNPTMVSRMDLAAAVQICGISIAVLLSLFFSLIEWNNRLKQDLRQQVESEALEDRRRFLQRLDHELKNPLTAIQAGLANLTSDLDKDVVTSIKAQVQRLSRLVSDLRKLSDLETRPIENDPVDLALILSTVVELSQDRISADTRNLILSLPQAPWPLPMVSGDADLLLLSFHNLVDNAVKFSQPGDNIEVRAFEDNTQVVVEVADTGPGIPAEELPHIWEELYRGESARGIQGSGLGLALVRAVVERHRGQVTVRSREKQGTVVSIRLPALNLSQNQP